MIDDRSIGFETILTIAAESGDQKTVRTFIESICPDERPKLLKSKEHSLLSLDIMLNRSSPEICHFLNWVSQLPPHSYFIMTKPILLAICCTENRDGAEDELQSLRSLDDVFEIEELIDPTEGEIMIKLREIQFLKANTAYFVVVMAHGMRGCFKVKDKFVIVRDLIMTMCPPELSIFPKVRSFTYQYYTYPLYFAIFTA